MILGLICVLAFAIRLFAVTRYESVIHEFDPYFNFRTTKVSCHFVETLSSFPPRNVSSPKNPYHISHRFCDRGSLSHRPLSHTFLSLLLLSSPPSLPLAAFQQYLTHEGFLAFLNWFDDRGWYPLGRTIGGTIYPGLMLTAASLSWVLNIFHLTVNIRNICVFLAPLFAANTAIATYLLTEEVSFHEGGGVG